MTTTSEPKVRRVVLVGPTRSGTTLVQRLLCEYSACTTFPETHVFVRGFRRTLRGWEVDRPELRRTLRHVCSVGGIDVEPPTVDEREPAERVAASLIDWFDRVAAARSASCWIEKTPSHFRRLGIIRSALTQSGAVIHVVRRPRDCVASRVRASRAWGLPRGWSNSSLHWLAAFVAMQAGRHRFGDHVVSFERVLDEPARAIEEVADRAGLRRGVGANIAEVVSAMALEEETWRHRALEPPARRAGSSEVRPPVLARVALALLDALWWVSSPRVGDRRR